MSEVLSNVADVLSIVGSIAAIISACGVAHIHKEIEVLRGEEYPLLITNGVPYSSGLLTNSWDARVGADGRSLSFEVDFSSIEAPDEGQFCGYAIQSLPLDGDWRSFVRKGYSIVFDYEARGSIADGQGAMHVELTGSGSPAKPLHRDVRLFGSAQAVRIPLSGVREQSAEHITELCFVFFPQKCHGLSGTVHISGLRLEPCKQS